MMGGRRIPRFGPDQSLVSGYTMPGYQVYARLFVPFPAGEHDNCIRWSVAAARVGLRLTAYTRWSQLVGAAALLAGPDAEDWHLPMGCVDSSTMRRLLGALRLGGSGMPTTLFCAVWEGYGGDVDDNLRARAQLISTQVNMDSYLWQRSFWWTRADVDWLADRERTWWAHAPVALWSSDLSFSLACPLYHDSYYLSGSVDVLQALRAAGLDVMEISRDAPLPSEGD